MNYKRVVFFVVAVGTTMLTTAGLPIATGTILRRGTTTTASGASCGMMLNWLFTLMPSVYGLVDYGNEHHISSFPVSVVSMRRCATGRI